MTDERLEIQKRHTLNWLIQGAAQHAGMTFHHMIRDELSALDSELIRYYDQYALINLLQNWHPARVRSFGWPADFWAQAVFMDSHPFFRHPLLSRFGGVLAEAGRQRAIARSPEKGFDPLPEAFRVQVLHVVQRLRELEAPHRQQLVRLAKQTASMVWGIPFERLDGELHDRLAADPRIHVRSKQDAAFSRGIVGLGSVEQNGDDLIVVGRATNWQLLAKELVKGTAELICLHGLNDLDDDTYERVLDVTDRLDLEPWMLQSGGELWRRLLASFPDDVPLATLLMRLARLPAGILESVLAAVIEKPEGTARLTIPD